MITQKENYMTIINGGVPEWVPMRTFGKHPLGRPAPFEAIGAPRVLDHFFSPGEAKSIWGVTYIPVEEAGGAKVPDCHDFVLKDIKQWRNIVIAPDFSGVDLKKEFEESMIKRQIDRNVTVVSYDVEAGFFQTLVSLMGFSEALCAMYEEPEEVMALLQYLCDFYFKINEECIEYCQPDMVSIFDDTAFWNNPFFPVDMYRKFFKPLYTKQAQLAIDRGIVVDIHNCGRCEDFIEDWFDFGVRCWNPAQTCNDLVGIKNKYGNKLVICGGWDAREDLLKPDVSEMMVKQSVCDTIDKLAPGGGYIFCGSFLGPVGDPETAKKNKWIAEAVEEYGSTFYKTK